MDDIGVPLDLQRLQLISMDPPRHDRLKALVIKQFTPEAIAAHEDAVNQIIGSVLDSGGVFSGSLDADDIRGLFA